MSNTAREQRPIILIVDDELSFTSGMQVLLEVWGYIAPTASNADEAAVMIRNNPPISSR